jgi:hypothetical protein
MDGETKRRKIDVLYDDVLGDVKKLVAATTQMLEALGEAKEGLDYTREALKADITAASAQISQSAEGLQKAVAASIRDEGKRVATTSAMDIRNAAAEAVALGAQRAALTAMSEPLHYIEGAYKEITAKIIVLGDLAKSVQKKLTLEWGKVLGLAFGVLVLGGTISVFAAHYLETKFPVLSKAEKIAISAGNTLMLAWPNLDEATKHRILQAEAAAKK